MLGVIAASMCAAVDEERVVVDVDEHRRRADVDDRLDRRDERVGGHDDLVARTDAEPAQDQLDRVGAVGDADAFGDAAVLGVLGFEGRDVRAADEAVGGGDLRPRFVELVGDLGVLAGEVEERDVGVDAVIVVRPIA